MLLTSETLDAMYEGYAEHSLQPTKLGFLSSSIFDLPTYDDELDNVFGEKLYYNLKKIFYKECYDEDRYQEFIATNCLLEKLGMLEWGTSIRHPWFLYDKDKLFFDVINVRTDSYEYGDGKIMFLEENMKTLLDWMER